MRTFLVPYLVLAALPFLTTPMLAVADDAEVTTAGERLAPATYGPGVVESMAAVMARDLNYPRPLPKGRNGNHGEWVVPSRRATNSPHSGAHNVVNKWGDTRMGIGFPQPVDVYGAYFAGQGGAGSWAAGIRVVGYREGQRVAATDWFRQIGSAPAWMAMDLNGVDRIEVLAEPVVDGAGWYSMDDLTYAPADDGALPEPVLVTFDDLNYDIKLTGTDYAGLSWEVGTGEFELNEGVPAPQRPIGQASDTPEGGRGTAEASAELAILPSLVGTFQGVLRGDAGSSSYPPDTIGAIGPNHYVETVNRNFAVYNRQTRQQLMNVLLGSFLPGSNGDPRVLFDQHSNRWIVIVSDFDETATIFLAVSLTSDPMGSWFKTSFLTAQGSDAGKWPDYPTLGVDVNGIYTAAYMVGGTNRMTIFAIDKAPLIAPSPSLGTVTAFRELSWDGAIQPAHTYGNPGAQYFVSLSGSSSTRLRIRRVNPPLTSPTLTDVGTITVSSFSDPPLAPALGSTTSLDTVGDRPMMSVYRNGSLWTCHTISVNGRAGCRWYELNPVNRTVIQYGNVGHSTLHFFFPSIMVNAHGGAVMAFTGSSAAQYAGCYYTGRLASDTAGQMATPVMYKAGTAAQNNLDSFGRNRWGDYSYTTLDPLDETTFWTLQEYGHSENIWGTYGAILTLADGDCNSNGVMDRLDISGGTSQDCNSNYLPDECELAGGLGTDCNSNGVLDQCDVLSGYSQDCNGNEYPDDCDIAQYISADCNTNSVPDECDIAGGFSNDCNANGVPDECDLAMGYSSDCNANGIPDDCDIASGLSQDCNANGVPDSCDFAAGVAADCNANGVPDDCDVAAHTSQDCNQDGLPDECEVNTRQGLAGAYYDNQDLTGILRSRLDSTVQFNWASAAPWSDYGPDAFSVRWTGYVRTTATGGSYTFYTFTDDGVRLWVAGQLLVDRWNDQSATEWSGAVALQANRRYPVVMEYYEAGGDAVAELRWQPPGQSKVVIPAANLVPGDDCNGNGILDTCDFNTTYTSTSPQLSPLGGVPQEFLLVSPPAAGGDVALSFTALGDLNFASEYVDVLINGTLVGTIYTGFYEDCVASQQDALTLPASVYNALAAGGNVTIRMAPSEGVDPGLCAPETSYIRVSISYLAVSGELDCNDNGILDTCDIGGGWSTDHNGNGVPDECEAPPVCRGDCNCNGSVGFTDIDLFVAAIPNNQANWTAKYQQLYGQAPPSWCWQNCDVNGNGNVGFDDIDPFVAKIPSACP